MRRSTQRSCSAQVLLWLACLVGALALASCSSDTNETSAAASADNGDTSGGQLDSEDADRLAEAQAQLEELQDFSFGSGGGVITIEGVDYPFDANVCYSQDTGFEATGPGQTADGVPYWASLSTGISTRASMETSGLPKESIDAFFGDAEWIESFGLQIELGKEDQFSSGDDSLADFRIDVFKVAESSDVSYTVEGANLSGSGVVYDDNGVAVAFGETVPVSFTAGCN